MTVAVTFSRCWSCTERRGRLEQGESFGEIGDPRPRGAGGGLRRGSRGVSESLVRTIEARLFWHQIRR